MSYFTCGSFLYDINTKCIILIFTEIDGKVTAIFTRCFITILAGGSTWQPVEVAHAVLTSAWLPGIRPTLTTGSLHNFSSPMSMSVAMGIYFCSCSFQSHSCRLATVVDNIF